MPFLARAVARPATVVTPVLQFAVTVERMQARLATAAPPAMVGP